MILPVPLDTKNYIFTMVPEDDTSLNSIQPIFVQLLGLKGTTAKQVIFAFLSLIYIIKYNLIYYLINTLNDKLSNKI